MKRIVLALGLGLLAWFAGPATVRADGGDWGCPGRLVHRFEPRTAEFVVGCERDGALPREAQEARQIAFVYQGADVPARVVVVYVDEVGMVPDRPVEVLTVWCTEGCNIPIACWVENNSVRCVR